MDIHGIAPLLQVFDMPTAIHFYRDVLGFKVHATSQPGDDCNWAWLKLNGADLMLNTAYEAEQRPAALLPARAAATTTPACISGAKTWRPLTSTFATVASIPKSRRSRRMA
jgi:catechol 2,3-dioxygenase-like lactoylglutathione lyase family enzyme